MKTVAFACISEKLLGSLHFLSLFLLRVDLGHGHPGSRIMVWDVFLGKEACCAELNRVPGGPGIFGTDQNVLSALPLFSLGADILNPSHISEELY